MSDTGLKARARLTIELPAAAHRRIRMAAAKRDQSIREYVWEAVEARLKRDLGDVLRTADSAHASTAERLIASGRAAAAQRDLLALGRPTARPASSLSEALREVRDDRL